MSIKITKVTIGTKEYTDFSQPLEYHDADSPHIIGEIERGIANFGMTIKRRNSAETPATPGPNFDTQCEWFDYGFRENNLKLVACDVDENETVSVDLDLRAQHVDSRLDDLIKDKNIYLLSPAEKGKYPVVLGLMGALGIFAPHGLSLEQRIRVAGTMTPMKWDAGHHKYVPDLDGPRKKLRATVTLLPNASNPMGFTFGFSGVLPGFYSVLAFAGTSPDESDKRLFEMTPL